MKYNIIDMKNLYVCMLLTAREIMPVTMPVLILVVRYFESKLRSVIEAGFIPFFKCPICKFK